MICLSLRFFLTLFFLIFLRTLVRILLVFLSGAAFRYFGFPFLIRLNLLLFTSAGGSRSSWDCWLHSLYRLDLLLLTSAGRDAFRGGGLHSLCRLNLLLFTSAGGTAFRGGRLHSLYRLDLLLLTSAGGTPSGHRLTSLQA